MQLLTALAQNSHVVYSEPLQSGTQLGWLADCLAGKGTRASWPQLLISKK